MSGARTLLLEVRQVAETFRDATEPGRAGPIVVGGMLCEQLARELGAGAEPGAVVVDGTARAAGAEVLVHVMAAEPSADDEAVVRAADREGVPVVLVQLWPQEQWTPPFVLTPFVVECRAGQGFPIEEIAARIAEAAENDTGLARGVPVLRDVVEQRLVTSSMLRSALVAVSARRSGRSSRRLLLLEQAATIARLRAIEEPRPREGLQVVAGAAAAAVGASFALREAARRAREVLPRPVVDVGLAAGTTWALGQVARRLSSGES